MKLALNGALTIGTDDGANIEIRENVGDDNIFIFGLTTPRGAALRASRLPADARSTRATPALKAVLDAIAGGAFSPDEPGRYRGLVDSLLWGGDHYLLLADFAAYVAAQARVDALYRQPERVGRAAPSPTSPAWAPSRPTARSANTPTQIWGVDAERADAATPRRSLPCADAMPSDHDRSS